MEKKRTPKCVFSLAIAALLLTACSSGNSENAEYAQGTSYLEAGDYAAAITALSSAAEAEPESADIYVALGDAYTGAAKDADEAAVEAVLSDWAVVDWSEITVSLNDETYTLQELYENAVSEYEKAVTLINSSETTDDSSDALLEETAEKLSDAENAVQESQENYAVALTDLAEGILQEEASDEDKELALTCLDMAAALSKSEATLNRIAGVSSLAVNVADSFPTKKTATYSMTDDVSTYTYEYEIDSDGNVALSCYFDDDGSLRSTSVYDASGNLTKETEFSNGIATRVCNYDENGNIVLEQKYDDSGNLTRTYTSTFTYNDDGTLALEEKEIVQSDGTEYTYSYVYTYDGTTQNIAVIYSSTKMTQQLMYKIAEYDESGNMIKIATYNMDNSLAYYTTYEYDDQGKIVMQQEYATDGSYLTTIWEY